MDLPLVAGKGVVKWRVETAATFFVKCCLGGDFVSSSAKLNRTMVWICIPSLNLVFYDENLLMAMALAIGKPIRVDMHTCNVER